MADSRTPDDESQLAVDEKTRQLATLYGYDRVLKDSLPITAWKSEILELMLWRMTDLDLILHANIR